MNEEWQPNEPMILMGCQAWAKLPEDTKLRTVISQMLIAVRPLIVAETIETAIKSLAAQNQAAFPKEVRR